MDCIICIEDAAVIQEKWIRDIHSKFAPIEEGDHKSNASITTQRQVLAETVPYLTANLSYSQFMYEFHLTDP